ncbi:EAL domain-containing protein [Hahella sp. KA22]|uniref:putative bifunctional diguanylate cyclase/phosphodiesterase n=1 Tax=Hahella sp. KA22 TaxID=1628392 RepID=UPI000FDEAA38|nr:EAL domain-containing response regulator [Hahella sp. KA22]AZZ93166.1 EAL domain-containing response regulator [Hahella sp. KA22]QAY56540.1 EAL domain-containing protein [Hahella sp. KA22]
MLQLEGSRLLIVDDEQRNTRLLADIFRAEGCDVHELNNSCNALKTVASYEPDLIILDVMMPGKNGFELTREIKSHEAWKHIPIILLTALADRDSCVSGLEAGAEDYVSKPFNRRELCARVNNLLKLKKLHDFQNQNIRLLEQYDPVTGLPRKEILLEIANTLFKKKKGSSFCVCVCEIDLDQTLIGLLSSQDRDMSEKQISRTVVERMSAIFPPGILMGCLGPGKFGVVLEASENEAASQLRLLQHRLQQPFLIHSQEFHLKFSIGYMPPDQPTQEWRVLFNKAEMALLEAKKEGGNLLKKFIPEMDAENYERWWLSQALFQALREQQFEVYFQPLVDIHKETLVGFEALLRWQHPDKGFISPARFIPLAEENGHIYDLSLWMIEQVCQQIVAWRSIGPRVRMAINISPAQLYRDDFTEDFVDIFSRYHLTPNDFELELTESSLMDPKGGGQLQALWRQGFDIAIDDFGTGYSNLEYLKKYPFNRLKIDRSFISNICESSDDIAIVKAILAIAEHMGFKVIAEGIETVQQLEKLRELGCHEAQGFYFSKPVPATIAADMLRYGLKPSQS